MLWFYLCPYVSLLSQCCLPFNQYFEKETKPPKLAEKVIFTIGLRNLSSETQTSIYQLFISHTLRKLSLFLLFVVFALRVQAQNDVPPSAQKELSALQQAESRKDKATVAKTSGSLGQIYLDAAKELPKSDSRREAWLDKSIEYSNKCISAADEAGDVDAMREAYKTLSAAQKAEGSLKDALDSYRKMMSLKHGSKKALQIEKKQIEYEHARKEDSMLAAKKLTEQHLEAQKQLATQNSQRADSILGAKKLTEQHLEKETRKLTEKEKELAIINQNLQIAEEQKALQAANLELQQSKLQLQKDELEKKDRAIEVQRQQRYALIAGIAGLLLIIVLACRGIYVQ
jgi:hypothetical protein